MFTHGTPTQEQSEVVDMWRKARADIENIFFKDRVAIYLNDFVENDIGETIEQPVLLGEYTCNIENGASGTQSSVSGKSAPQAIRVSTVKGINLDYDKTYKLRIVEARLVHSDEYWQVDGWLEGQLSTVINASREVAV